MSDTENTGGTPVKPTYRASYKIDLSNPTQSQLDQIKSAVIDRISRSVVAEQEASLAGGDASLMPTHDKHDSFHSSGP